MPSPAPTKLGLVDDHKLFRKGLISLIEMVNKDYTILFEADNGLDLQAKIDKNNPPDIILMDVNMPGMDGFASVQWLRTHFADVKVLVVSMIEQEETIVRMLKLGVKGYLCKDVEPKDLGDALLAVANKGFYYTDFITGKLVHSLQNDDAAKAKNLQPDTMNDREKEFIQLACSEMTYNEIAAKMFLSPKTIDGYRNALFEKLSVKSRVGLVMYAIRNGIVNVDWNR
ncbi:response regulator transcription factor [Chryseolinea lacunae]|uniref:Response regulator transcription factor n=1 Tax=Chryseolinea lacunae TaxID=2801331 RepID=A0ABS1KR78_9BACT|nr:response regulator transcription factor [Chryseolinea lacunae]MBL0741985.1 response regulator transcription factor [Chryseolinea lacunae]